MKKVVILSAFLSPLRSGAEACAEEVALELSDKYDITIVTARMHRDLPREDLLGGKVPVVRIGLGFGFDKWLFPFLAPFSVRACVGAPRCGAQDNDDPAIIHAILETFAGLALHLCKLIVPKLKRILTMQTTNRSFLKGMVVRSPDKVTAISEALVKIAEELGRNDVIKISNGLHLGQIPVTEKERGRIVFVGRLEKMKGIDTLLTAFAKLKMYNVQCTIRVVGDGSERSRLEQLAIDLGIVEHVTFTGFLPVPDVYKEFAKAEIFCGLSRSEALGNVFLEAQAAGCAVIGTTVGGIPDIIKDGETGLLVSSDDADAAADALKKLLEDTSLLQKLAEEGKKNAQNYDWSKIAKEYESVYESFL